MNLLQLQRGGKHYGAKVLFSDASFAINQDEHVGVIGPNGAGKTTLFKILVGQETLDSGEITAKQGLRIGYLEQEAEWSLDQTVEDHLTHSCRKPIWQLKQIGLGLGLDESHFNSPLRSLSGGYRMRAKLLYLIGQEPDLMLLDEPTNFLDLESILALEGFLQEYAGAFLLISHDREFLRRTTDHTLEVEGGDITKFPGHIDDYFEQKSQLRSILQAQAANQETKKRQIQDFVSRFGAKATKARQAQSRLKQLEKMTAIEVKDAPVRARIRIPPPQHTGREIIKLSAADLGYGESNRVLKKVNLTLERSSHVGVVGVNGAGKSTLLKSLAGTLPFLSGTRELGYQVSLSYFSQHTADQLDLNDTVMDALERAAHREVDRQDILNMAGSLLFSGADVHKKIRVLSGGEKTRVALGQILLKRAPLLLLDEPTNHLDFDTVEALTESLRDYAGTVVVVSHDRGFIGRIANRILEIRDGRVELYPGTYDEYVWSVQKGSLRERFADAESEEVDGPPSSLTTKDVAAQAVAQTGEDGPATKVHFRDESKALQAQARELRKKIAKAEERLSKLEQNRDQLTARLTSVRGFEAADLSKQLSALSEEIAHNEEELLQFMQDLEERECRLGADPKTS